jgi:tRNA A37 threonylcarbamoyladenosine modification protein TsaB
VHHADAGYWQVVIRVGVAVAVACALNLDNKLQPATSLWLMAAESAYGQSQITGR